MIQERTYLRTFLPDPLLRLDASEHAYFYKDERVPGVSEILKDLGIIDLSRIPADRLEFSRTKGQYVHKAIQLYLAGTLDWETVDVRIKPYVECFRVFWEDNKLIPLIVEKSMFSEDLHYAGTPDCFAEWNSREVLIDWKSGLTNPQVLSHRLSTKAYDMMFPGERDRFTIQLFPDRPAAAHKMDDPQDEYLWTSCCAIYHAKRRSK